LEKLTIKSKGVIMKYMKDNNPNRYDGAELSKLIDEFLSK
jgi:hypothetical protein